MSSNSTKEQGGRNPIKGKLEQLYVTALVKALLELVSITNPDTSQRQEVRVIWSGNNCELQVSSTSKALLELIKKHNTEIELEKKTEEYYEDYKRGGEIDSSQKPSNQKRNMSFKEYQIDRVRNAMYLLEKIQLLEDKRPKNKAGKLENPRLRAFNLKLNKEKNLEDNCNYVDKILKQYCNNDSHNSGNNSDNKKSNPIKNEQDLVAVKLKLLRSLNCRSQKDVFEEQIGTHRVGFFRIQTQTEIRPWFLWVLEKKIANFEIAEKIKIYIDFRMNNSFEFFWQQFKQYIKVEENLESANVIEALAEFYTTKSVVISIISRNPLTTDILNRLNNFYSQLIEKINSIQNSSKQNCLVVFIMDKFRDSINYQNQADQEQLKLLVLTQIKNGEVNSWLDEIKNEKLDKQIGYNLNDNTYREVQNFGENPDAVIDSICKLVFKSDSGLEEFEPHWQHWK